ncbi:MAG: hypothetical protein QOG70_2832 [Solirubrobacteraceae bacterium]|jgi:hypothetical protein|nr:hypothetical protein [Solirubrobacteraceae bacterium]
MAEQSTPSTSTTKRAASATKRSTAAKKAAATRSRTQAAEARKRSTAAKKAAETRRELARTPVDRAQEYVERAVLVPVGAAFVARDTLVATVDGVRKLSRESAEKELAAQGKRLRSDLKRFERRGKSERKRLEREVRKARRRVEREVTSLRRDVTKQAIVRRRGVAAQADLLTARAQNLLQTGLTRGTRTATHAQERASDVV